ncbi:Nramp family divalent metal transporter [Patescibacteria group bacterium]|nr:Nramp family divalent metal transporter [Patescibacteria group bacterium]
MSLKPLKVNLFPDPPSLVKIIGPSFIILGLGLGSGEIILWPYLASNYGMGIIWGALLGLTFQFFMNMEIERYALVRGESVFVGLARKIRGISFWFLLSTFIPWVWPGIIASSAKLFGTVFGFGETKYLAIIFLIIIGLILSLGPVLYKTVETLQKTLILIGVPTIFFLSIFLANQTHWIDLLKGSIGIGNNYNFLPAGIPIASFLAALAYAGAGGNLNLAQAFYIKEKGFGMGKYSGRITSVLTGKKEEISVEGSKFEITNQNLSNFKKWWRNINIEHFLIFWLTGSVTIVLLSLLAYATTYGLGGNSASINFVLTEGKIIGERIFPFAGVFFLLIAGFTLFGTQLTVFDATSRILSENLILSIPSKFSGKQIPAIYYTVLWLQILGGITIFLMGFSEPLQLLIIAAVLNAFAMFVHVGLTLWLNLTSLEKVLRPAFLRITMMLLAFFFYGGFSLYVFYDVFF